MEEKQFKKIETAEDYFNFIDIQGQAVFALYKKFMVYRAGWAKLTGKECPVTDAQIAAIIEVMDKVMDSLEKEVEGVTQEVLAEVLQEFNQISKTPGTGKTPSVN